jgi:hypothetical protein
VGRCQLESGLLILLLAGSEEHEQERQFLSSDSLHSCTEAIGEGITSFSFANIPIRPSLASGCNKT